MNPATGPLAGLRVIELGEMVAGPYTAKLLADFGAEVIKVEDPEAGDPARFRGPYPDGVPDPERSGLFIYLNTNKLGITLALTGSDGQAVLHRLLDRADVLVTNLSRRRLADFDLLPVSVRARHPRLIVTTVTPFGLDGPYTDYQGDELVAFAMGGLAAATPGMPDAVDDPEAEPPLHPAAFVAETIAGVTGAVATMLAWFTREQTGSGAHVDVSQQAAVAAMEQRDMTAYSYAGLISGRLPNTIGRMPNFYLPCKDGYVVVAAPLDHQWNRLVELMGDPDWAHSDLFNSADARALHWDGLKALLLDWTMSLTGDEIYRRAQQKGLPFFPFYPLSRTLTSEQVAARESLATVRVAGTAFQIPGAPFRMSKSPWLLRRPAPRLGGDTRHVLRTVLGEPVSATNQPRDPRHT